MNRGNDELQYKWDTPEEQEAVKELKHYFKTAKKCMYCGLIYGCDGKENNPNTCPTCEDKMQLHKTGTKVRKKK